MARKPRQFGTSGIYHVILRGNNRQNIFNDAPDRNFFLARLEKYSRELGIAVYAYCLMNNHVHLLIGNAGRNMSLLVQKIANSYVFYFNRKYDRCGHLFQGRFKSEPVQDETYFKTVLRYILQNCEKAGLGHAEKYRWNSFSSLTGYGRNSFVDSGYVRNLFASGKELLDFLSQHAEGKCMEYEEKLFLSDSGALRLIKKLFRISSPYRLERLPVERQAGCCRIMKTRGISMNQIARLTGISRAVIRKS